MIMAKLLIACEESQVVCKAFRAFGIEAYSCDIQDPSGGHPEWHILGDALEAVQGGLVRTMDGQMHNVGKWDMLIAHPPCTYLSKAGANRLVIKGCIQEERMKKAMQAKAFFMALWEADCPRVVVENPVPIKICVLPKYTQIVQPYYFGDPWMKTTCLWLRGVPPLFATELCIPDGKWVETTPHGATRASEWKKKGKRDPKERSKTFPGIAQAMAEQWGPLLLENNQQKRSKGNMSTEISVNVRRTYIETNLEQCKKNIALSMWQIGNLLNQAKDEGVVPHGEWTAWATTHSGLNERGVQLAMRQARELAQDSPLLELDDSKINALIRIPAEEREAFAARIDAENATSREVTEAVAQYRRELDEVKKERNALIDKAAEKGEEVKRLRGEAREKDKAREKMEKDHERYRDWAQKVILQKTAEIEALKGQEKSRAGDDAKVKTLTAEVEKLKDQLQAAENNTTLSDSERAAYERRIEQLEDELDAADMRANVSTMRGGGQAVDPISTINAAIGTMIASAGGSVAALVAVQMDDGTRQMLMSHAVTLRTMSQAILDAIGG